MRDEVLQNMNKALSRQMHYYLYRPKQSYNFKLNKQTNKTMMQGRTSNENKFIGQKGKDNIQLDRDRQEEDDEKQQKSKFGCGIMRRYPIISLLLFVFSGIGVGIALSMWNPDESDSTSKEVALQWIGLVGDLFLRCLKAIVLPIVFVNVIIAVVDMMMVGAAGGVSAKTVGLYLATTLLAGTLNMIRELIERNIFVIKQQNLYSVIII